MQLPGSTRSGLRNAPRSGTIRRIKMPSLEPHGALDGAPDPSLDMVSWKAFNAEFERHYRKAQEKAFQELFRQIMRRAHGSEFAEVRPHGNIGDMSCDGYLRTSRTVFACYAPKSYTDYLKRVLKKVRSDHAGALEHWKAYMAVWSLVHNSDDGLPAPLHQLLEDLRGVDKEIAVEDWGIEDVRKVVRRLRKGDLEELFGPQMSLKDLLSLSHDDIRIVVENVSVLIDHQDEGGLDVRPVPAAKMEFNNLPRAVRDLLKLGEQKSVVVQQYFERQTDPLLPGRLASRFQRRYIELRDQKLRADEIFFELQLFAGWPQGPTRQVGSLALLAFLFEACHIFERPPEELQETP